MNRLTQQIELVQLKLDSWKKHSLKETPTRTILIDPLLESLGWDVRDPDEVQLEYPTVDGKSVDYALKINRRPVLLVEAKALDDNLSDVKSITQVVGYAANDGIEWCVLTNGIKWRVYRSTEKCPAPEKLMFELSLDSKESEGVSSQQLAKLLWRLSRDSMAEGNLDKLGEQTFTDGKVRKAMDGLLLNPPKQLIKIVKDTAGDPNLSPSQIKESLSRVWLQGRVIEKGKNDDIKISDKQSKIVSTDKSKGKQSKGKGHPESIHLEGKSQEVLALYRTLDSFCISLGQGLIEKSPQKRYLSYLNKKKIFCSVVIQQGGLRVYLKLKLKQLKPTPSNARDVSSVGHWGVGDVELAVHTLEQLNDAKQYIRQSFDQSL